jgi:AcrR family transcriptional regulator
MNGTKAAQTLATKRKLEQIARELFAERGFAGVSSEELVAKADVTRGALYHHYDGKEGVFELSSIRSCGRCMRSS